MFGLTVRLLSVVALLACAGVVQGQTYNLSDFDLAPGERLVAVDGKPVQLVEAQALPSEKAMPVRRAVGAVTGAAVEGVQRLRNRWEVARDARVYADCLREAQILAARGPGYHLYPDGGHPIPSRGLKAGTGYSRDPNRPYHCWLGELPESRLVARAMVPGPNGTYFWSARYR